MESPMSIFPKPDDEPAPSFTDPDDLAFFAEHPDREYRARAPFKHELEEANRRGHSLELASDQALIVITMRCGTSLITTMLAKCRLSPPGTYPSTDDEIRRAFKGPVPIAQPARTAA